MDRTARLTLLLGALALAPLTGCTTLHADYSGLRVEQRPAEGTFRLSNGGPRDATLNYNFSTSFGDYQMFFVRFRDGDLRVIGDDGAMHGWWTPLSLTSRSYAFGERANRRTLTIPAGGRIDMPRDFAQLTVGLYTAQAVRGPCEAQIMLVGYRGMLAGERRIEVVSEWQPAPCPQPRGVPR